MAINALSQAALRGALQQAPTEAASRNAIAPATAPAVRGDSLGVDGAIQEADFPSALEDALRKVDGLQKTADARSMDLVSGKDVAVHDVMIALTEAELAVQLTTTVATKAIQAYQEIWRMDV